MHAYSEKLKLAMAEIKAILEREDIAAHVVLYHEHLSEYLLKIDPSWSVAYFENEGIRFRSKLADFDGDRAKQQEATTVSVGMLRHFIDLLSRDAYLLMRVLDALADQFEIEHTDGVHTPHRTH